MVNRGPAESSRGGELLASALIDELLSDDGSAEDAFWRGRTLLLREIGRRARDADLSAIGTSEPILTSLKQAPSADLVDALAALNRERRRRQFGEWTDVSAQVALLLGSRPRSIRSHQDVTSAKQAARWWIDGVPGDDMQELVRHVIATRGLLLTQAVIRRQRRLLFLREHLRLAHEGLDRIGFAGWWPGEAALVELITSGAGSLGNGDSLRIDVGPVLETSLDTASAPLLLVVGETRLVQPLSDAVSLALHAAPVQIIPPLAGLPLGLTADRAVAMRRALGQGLDEAVLFDRDGHIVDLCTSTLFLSGHDGTWSTPSSDLGAERSPLRTRTIDILGAEERTDITWPTLACSALYVLGRDGRISQVTRLETLHISANEASLAALTRARDIALEEA